MYSFILVHDFLPHHFHNGQEYVDYNETKSDGSHDCSEHDTQLQFCDNAEDDCCNETNKCNFPFHQNNLNEAGVYLSQIHDDITFSTFAIQIIYSVFIDPQIDNEDRNEIPIELPPVYKEPDLGSFSLRGPPQA